MFFFLLVLALFLLVLVVLVLLLLLLLQRSRAMQVRSSVRLMPQIQPSGRRLLPRPAAWSPQQHLVAMIADVSRYILGRTEGRGLGFGQLVRTHTGKCLKCQSSSDGLSDHSVLCAGGRWWSAGPAPVSKLGQGVPGIQRFSFFQSPLYREWRSVLACWARSSLQIGSRCAWYPTFFFLPVSIVPRVEKCLGLSVGDRVLCLRSQTANF